MKNVDCPTPQCWRYLGQLPDAREFASNSLLRDRMPVGHNSDLPVFRYSAQKDVAPYPSGPPSLSTERGALFKNAPSQSVVEYSRKSRFGVLSVRIAPSILSYAASGIFFGFRVLRLFNWKGCWH